MMSSILVRRSVIWFNKSNIYRICSRYCTNNIDDINSALGIDRDIIKKEDTNKPSSNHSLDGVSMEITTDNNDIRVEDDYPNIRSPGPKQYTDSKENAIKRNKPMSYLDNQEAYDRVYIEKKHIDYGWSPKDSKRSKGFNINDEVHYKPNNISNYNELMVRNIDKHDSNNKQGYYNPNDLTTFEGYSNTSRHATYKAALNLGVHWGKESHLWKKQMTQFLKGIVNGRHVFDLTLTIANLRKCIRLMQSLVMDGCNILFVANSDNPDLRILGKIMATRCNMPCMDEKWIDGGLTNWNKMSASYRGPGMPINKKPTDNSYSRYKFHRMDGMREPPDFIFMLNRKGNDILIHECQIKSIPIACLCDSNDSTKNLNYVIPCNTQSIQSLHFILDMITRGILEAQSKMDSLWYAKLKDQKKTRNALYDIELQWQTKYDLYEQLRYSKTMTAGNVQQSGDMSGVLSEEKMEIPINYDDNDFDDGKSFLYAGNKLQDGTLMDEGFVRKFNVANTQSGSMDDVMNKAQNRLYKLQNVKESKEAQIRHESGKMKLGAFPPNVNNDYVESMKSIQSTHDFSIRQLERFANRERNIMERRAKKNEQQGK